MRGRVFVVSFAVVCTLVSVNCGSGARSETAKPEGVVRIATYNLQWFSEAANPKRISNIKSVLSNVAPDIVGLEEVESVAAVRQVFDNSWDVGMLDDRQEHQELAIAVRKPFVLVSAVTVFKDKDLDDAFPGKRDVLRCIVQTPGEKQLVVYVVHMKSRRGGRIVTDVQREEACGLLAAYVRSRRDEPNVVVMGDFNDNPFDASLNILESGNNMAKGGLNPAGEVLLFNLTESLASKDYVSEGVHDLYNGSPINPIVTGAKADNDRLRGKEYEFPRDVQVPQILFDQILVSPVLKKTAGTPTVYCGEDALRGQPGRTSVDGSNVDYLEKGDLASDHLPVYVDIKVP